MVSIKFAVVAALAAAPAVFAFESYLAKIPNGAALGKKLGHSADGYTPFGDLYKAKGGWAGACKEKWPGGTATVGAALGDPCCKFSGGAAQVTLSAPDAAAKECDAGGAPAAAPAATTAAPAAAPAAGAATPAPAATTAKPAGAPAPAVPAAAPTPAPAGPGKVLPAVFPTPAPASANTTKPAPTPASSKPGQAGGAPHKLCH